MAELEQYDPKLLKKPQIVAANKTDIVTDQDKYDEFMEYMKDQGRKVFPISAATGKGITELLNEVLHEIEIYEEPEEDQMPMYDFAADDYDADYKKISAYVDDDGAFVLEGKQLTKIFNSTNFTDSGSIRYLYNYILKQGGIRLLQDLGLKEGDTVRIQDFEFEYTED